MKHKIIAKNDFYLLRNAIFQLFRYFHVKNYASNNNNKKTLKANDKN